MAVVAAPAVATAGRAVAGKAAQSAAGKAAGKGAQAAAGGAAKGGGGGAAADALAGLAGGGGGGGGKKKDAAAPAPRDRKGEAKTWGKKQLTTGSAAKYKKMLVAEFLVCILLLGLSPLAKKDGEMSATRFMKRGTATCFFFIILGIISGFGAGAAKSASMFGALVTLVLLVDQREAFGKTAQLLNAPDANPDASTAGVGPDESTDAPPDAIVDV